MRYELQHVGTQLGTGSFAPVPLEQAEFETGLEYLKNHPYDEFMHNYLIHVGMTFGPNLIRHLMASAPAEGPHLLALMVELGLLNDRAKGITDDIERPQLEELVVHTPLIYIRWFLHDRDAERAFWLRTFADTVVRHQERLSLEATERPMPFSQDAVKAWQDRVVHVSQIARSSGISRLEGAHRVCPDPKETARWAGQALADFGLRMNQETRTPAGLTPFSLQREWQATISVSSGRDSWHLSGQLTSYGKGASMDEARASCLMEIAERVSAFASFRTDGPLYYEEEHGFIRGPYGRLADSEPVLDPNELILEVPYENQVLHWLSGERVTREGPRPVYVPAQLIFLFCNLDEISLTSGLPSTGLASGNTLEEAKRSALLEVIERDAERLVPYSRDKSFCLKPDSPLVRMLGETGNVRQAVQFMDMTSELGVPCYKAFVEGPRGEILKGCSANLDGRQAIVSALTEVPYHPSWFHLQAAASGLPDRDEDTIPSYATGNVEADLRRLEDLLAANNYFPVYVNLTRKDLGIPVVKALVPGLELLPEFQAYSPLTLRQFAHYFWT